MPKSSASTAQHRHTTVYDALEDRIKKHHATGFLYSDAADPIDERPKSRFAAPPDHALAARLNISVDDVPFPDTRDALDGKTLPKTDVLNAIHGYTSNLFHARAPTEEGRENGLMRCMDGSALLALGMFLEELADDLVGKQGHMMLAKTDCSEFDNGTTASWQNESIQVFERVDDSGTGVGPMSRPIAKHRNPESTSTKVRPGRSTKSPMKLVETSSQSDCRATQTMKTTEARHPQDSDPRMESDTERRASKGPGLYDPASNFGPLLSSINEPDDTSTYNPPTVPAVLPANDNHGMVSPSVNVKKKQQRGRNTRKTGF